MCLLLARIKPARPTKNSVSTRPVLSSKISLSGMHRTKTRLLCAPKAGTSKFVETDWTPRRDSPVMPVKKVRRLIMRRNVRNQDIISGPRGTTTFALTWGNANDTRPAGPVHRDCRCRSWTMTTTLVGWSWRRSSRYLGVGVVSSRRQEEAKRAKWRTQRGSQIVMTISRAWEGRELGN